jgi:hypothetical protein
MARHNDTDTLTRFDTAPDAPTRKNDFAGDDAETHRLDPRVYAPLRVCPECSLAWETSNKWCPSCGTAFERSVRESSTPTRVMPARPAASEPPRKRSARRQTAQSQPRGQGSPPQRQAPAKTGGSAGKNTLFAVLLVAAMIGAFFVGQSTRPSQASVDKSITEAVNTAKQSAVASYQDAFDKMQQQAADAIKDARAKGRAEGQANAQAEAQAQIDEQAQSGQSTFDKVTACVLHGEC